MREKLIKVSLFFDCSEVKELLIIIEYSRMLSKLCNYSDVVVALTIFLSKLCEYGFFKFLTQYDT